MNSQNKIKLSVKSESIYLLIVCLLAFQAISTAFAQESQVNISQLSSGQQVFVQVKTTKLRKEPKQWGAAITDLQYGDAVNVLELQGDWIKVTQQANAGYLHRSAISGRRILLAATAEAILNTSPEETDVYLAGKGFGSAVFERYVSGAGTNQDLSIMKGKENLSDQELEKFITKGKLNDA